MAYLILKIILAILYEQLDKIVLSFVTHLNASLLFFQNQYAINNNLIVLDPFLIPRAASNLSINTTGLFKH
jgi:uncharacterized membrane protein